MHILFKLFDRTIYLFNIIRPCVVPKILNITQKMDKFNFDYLLNKKQIRTTMEVHLLHFDLLM
jgi:hypothetical protein